MANGKYSKSIIPIHCGVGNSVLCVCTYRCVYILCVYRCWALAGGVKCHCCYSLPLMLRGECSTHHPIHQLCITSSLGVDACVQSLSIRMDSWPWHIGLFAPFIGWRTHCNRSIIKLPPSVRCYWCVCVWVFFFYYHGAPLCQNACYRRCRAEC